LTDRSAVQREQARGSRLALLGCIADGETSFFVIEGEAPE